MNTIILIALGAMSIIAIGGLLVTLRITLRNQREAREELQAALRATHGNKRSQDGAISPNDQEQIKMLILPLLRAGMMPDVFRVSPDGSATITIPPHAKRGEVVFHFLQGKQVVHRYEDEDVTILMASCGDHWHSAKVTRAQVETWTHGLLAEAEGKYHSLVQGHLGADVTGKGSPNA